MRLPSLLRTSPPTVAVAITPRQVTAVEVTAAGAGDLRVTAYAVEALVAGTVVPALNASNVASPAALEHAMRRVWEQLGHRPKRVALVVPDAVAKVSFVRFQNVPSRESDVDEMIKFQIRKAAPFRIEESLVSFSRGGQSADGQEFVVLQARRDVVGEYESACRSTGAEAGVVDLATFSVGNAVMGARSAPTGDWLLVHASSGGSALAIFRGKHIVFFRHRAAEGEGSLGDLVHQTAMYYQDRLGGSGFSRVFVAGSTQADGLHTVGATVEARLGRAVDAVDPLSSVTFSDRASLQPDLADALTPAIGIALAQKTDVPRRQSD